MRLSYKAVKIKTVFLCNFNNNDKIIQCVQYLLKVLTYLNFVNIKLMIMNKIVSNNGLNMFYIFNILIVF